MNADQTEKLVSPNLSALAYERLESAILQGEFGPGERLSESALARRYGISRGPLREAIGRLESRGLVERELNRSARVVSPDGPDLLHLLAVRESLEGMACRLAAERMSDDALDALEALLSDHAETEPVRTGRGYFQAADTHDFHQTILKASANPRLIAMLGGELYPLLRLCRHQISLRPGRPAAALAEHRNIVVALRSRDGDKAEATMRHHIRQSRAAVKESTT